MVAYGRRDGNYIYTNPCNFKLSLKVVCVALFVYRHHDILEMPLQTPKTEWIATKHITCTLTSRKSGLCRENMIGYTDSVTIIQFHNLLLT